MAKKPNTRKARRKKRGGGPFVRLLHLGALIALVGIIYSAWFWIDMRSWRPDEGTYPEQGAQIATGSAGVRFETLKATGADFVYLELGGATAAPDPGFRERFGAAREAGLGSVLYTRSIHVCAPIRNRPGSRGWWRAMRNCCPRPSR